MANQQENDIEAMLQQGKSKKQIWQIYKKKENESHKALFFINNSSLPSDRRKYQVINLVLALVLFFITAKKMIATFSFGTVDIYLILALVVPTINIYVLREILRFRRMGYQLLFVLSCLSLVQPENHHLQELFVLVILIGLSGLLYKKMFPAENMIKD